jgi:DNA topoisomerase-2
MVEEIKKLAELYWILKRPDTFIGSKNKQQKDVFIIEKYSNKDRLSLQKRNFSGGLVKIINEVIDNSVDHKINSYTKNKLLNKPVTKIDITFNIKNGMISVFNDGVGIPTTKSKTIKNTETNEFKYIPECIFTELRTGTNFNDNGNRYVGGRNGVGASLTTIFSTKLQVITVNSGIKYTQYFIKDYSLGVEKVKIVSSNPIIEKSNEKDFTRVTFCPDYKYFNSSSEEIFPIIKRRSYDIKYHFPNIKSIFNKEEIKFNNYLEVLKDFDLKNNNSTKYISKINDDFPLPKWEIDIFPSDNTNGQTILSYVNGIHTIRNGSHVNYIIENILNKFKELLPNDIYNIEKKDNENILKSRVIKKGISMILKTYISNPTFDSQSKESLSINKNMEEIYFSDKFIRKLLKNGFMEYFKSKCTTEMLRLTKDTQGSKRSKDYNIKNYIKAEYAGTKYSEKCVLIITEGASATGPIKNARLVIEKGEKTIGIFDSGGKPINPRGKLELKNLENKRFIDFRKVMGLDTRKKYLNTSSLKYSRIMICTDMDHDGSHIKGLIINWISNYWPDLLKIDGFITVFRTHCVKVFMNKKTIGFYSQKQFEKWQLENTNIKCRVKYYKGLGTSTSTEFKEYFKELDKNNVKLIKGDNTLNFLEMLFGKNADKRKDWILKNSNLKTNFSYDLNIVKYEDMLNNDSLEHAVYNLKRMIPHIADGFKLGQRKLMATLLFLGNKIPKTTGMKTSVISAKTIELLNYHHGNTSMEGTASRMAQNFVGSNNLNLLYPMASFGDRNGGYKSFASPRYTFTRMEDICKYLFTKDDNDCLNINEEEGKKVEPEFYIPPVPLIVINGERAGIGSGWSSKLIPHNPISVINFIKDRINGVDIQKSQLIEPYYYGFKGSINKNPNKNGYIIQGCYIYNQNTRKLNITELPVDEWLSEYEEWLNELLNLKIIDSWNPNSTDNKDPRIEKNINYEIILSQEYVKKSIYKSSSYISEEEKKKIQDKFEETKKTKGKEKGNINIFYDIIKDFRLRKTFSNNNIHLFGEDGKIKKYKNVYEIISDFMKIRIKYYNKRKQNLISKISKETKIISSKYKYIKCICEDVFEIKKISKEKCIENIEKYIKDVYKDNNNSYDYLMNMPIISFTPKKMEQLKNLYNEKIKELEIITNTSIGKIWLKDLDNIEREYNEMLKY